MSLTALHEFSSFVSLPGDRSSALERQFLNVLPTTTTTAPRQATTFTTTHVSRTTATRTSHEDMSSQTCDSCTCHMLNKQSRNKNELNGCNHLTKNCCEKGGEGDKKGEGGGLRSRDKWSRQLDFTFSCVGYAVGLGAFWRFPYLCMRNGGGAFLIPYFTFLFLCGLPLFFLELVIGQFSGLSPINIWNVCPMFKGIGWSMVIMSGIVTIYYNLIIAWVLYFLANSFTSSLPWASCDNSWNTPTCVERVTRWTGHDNLTTTSLYNMSTYKNMSSSMVGDGWSEGLAEERVTEGMWEEGFRNVTRKKMTASEEFWQYNVLELSEGIHELGHVRWQLLVCLFLAWLLVFLCISRGIKSSGKVVYVTATVPYIFLTLLLIRGLMLPGAVDGILFYLTPDFKSLLNPTVWAEACLQIFYSLGPAWGGLITMSSYNKFDNNCLRDSVVVSVACCGTSFYAGFVCFSVMGYMAREAGVNVSDVVTSGPGMAFTAYPEAITKLPISPLWAICFFIMLLTLGLDSQFGMLETCTSGFVDEFKRLQGGRRKTIFTAFVCVLQFIIGIPLVTQGGMYIFQILDWYAAAFSAMFIAFLECIVLAYIYKVDRLYDDMELMFGHRPSVWWRICWCYITPVVMLVMLVYSCVQMVPPRYGDYTYPSWAIALGWMVAMCSLIPMPLVALYRILQAKGPLITRVQTLLRPTAVWGPNSPEHLLTYQPRDYPLCTLNICISQSHRDTNLLASPICLKDLGVRGEKKDEGVVCEGEVKYEEVLLLNKGQEETVIDCDTNVLEVGSERL